jgi:Zn-dependent peptidase ImmA (M78 family)/DNA-binding XRE family transcriptional regulator
MMVSRRNLRSTCGAAHSVMTTSEFNPQRLALARRRCGLTKRDLAEALRVDQRTIIRYEAGDPLPPNDAVPKIANILGYPETFFFEPDIDEPDEDSASFRGFKTMPARERHAALAAGAYAFLLGDWVENLFELPVVELYDLSEETPEGAAVTLRQMWSLGERPIRNMVQLLEAKGVRVFTLAEDTNSVNAFSLWRRDKPYVFLNTMHSAEQSRFDAAHELGHLVLHRHGAPRGREAEFEANKFAAAFLMPESDVLATLPRVYSLGDIMRHKSRWRVSVAALNYRLHQIGITTDWQYKMLCIDLAKRGYRTCEPMGIERETSVVWQKVFGGLRQERVTKHDIAASLHLPVREIEKLVIGTATMVSVDGGITGAAQKTGKRADLRLVSN